MKRLIFVFSLLALCFCTAQAAGKKPSAILYDKVFDAQSKCPEFLMVDSVQAELSADGLLISGHKGMVQLNNYYSLGERTVRYYAKFSKDAVAVFRSNSGDFQLTVDMAAQSVSVNTSPRTWRKVCFLNPADEYIVEIAHRYGDCTASITDLSSGKTERIEMTNDGGGGYGAGLERTGFGLGMQHDYYCVALQSGSSVTIKRMTVLNPKSRVHLLIYGDSITEPENYYPAGLYPQAWTQLIMNHVNGGALCSGRGGCTIKEVLLRIKNELPFIQAEYVMVTIGTNGGNTEKNLSELVEYIIKQGSTPILNNIPCNESGTQVAANKVIEKVRQKYGINGCRFDIATSLNHDGQQVNTSCMFHEDLSAQKGPQIYHHPNAKGSQLMFLRTLVDVPEIYNR